MLWGGKRWKESARDEKRLFETSGNDTHSCFERDQVILNAALGLSDSSNEIFLLELLPVRVTLLRWRDRLVLLLRLLSLPLPALLTNLSRPNDRQSCFCSQLRDSVVEEDVPRKSVVLPAVVGGSFGGLREDASNRKERGG